MQRKILIMALCLGLFALFFLDRWQVSRWDSEKAAELDSMVRLCRIRLANTIETRFHTIEALASLFILHPDTGPDEFARFSENLLSFNPPIRALQYADSNTRVTYVYPSRGNEVAIQHPMTLLTDPKRGPFTKRAIQKRTAVLQGPFELRQGGSGIVLRFPIFRENAFLGLSIAIFDVPFLVKEAFQGLDLAPFEITLTDDQGNVFWRYGEGSQTGLSQSFSVADTKWTVSADWISVPGPPVFSRILVWGFGLAALLSALYTIQRSWKEARELEDKVEKRTAELSESEDKFRKFFNTNPSAVFVWQAVEQDFKLIEVNASAQDITEDMAAGFIGCRAGDIYKDLPLMTRKMAQCLSRKSIVEFEHHYKSRSKCRYDWVKFRLAFASPDLVLMYTDIVTRRKVAEEALRESEERQRQIIENSGAGYFFIDCDGCFRKVNSAWLAMHKYESDDEIIGKPFSITQTDEDREKAGSIFNDLTAAGKMISGEFSRKCRDGSIGYQTFSVIPVEKKGEVIGLEGFLIDVTEQKLLEDQLRQSRKMESIGTMAGGIAHDFNNILYMITGNAELAMEDVPEWNPVHANLKEIKAAGLRASGIVRQLMEFSRKTDQVHKPMDIAGVTTEFLKFLRSTFPASIEIQSRLPDAETIILGNAIQIKQVLMNLCNNAGQVMEKTGGILEIRGKRVLFESDYMKAHLKLAPGEYFKLTVGDTGPGIAPGTIDRIFDPYFTTKDVGKGSGMGLAVAHGIVNNHGGLILAENRPEKGALFSIYLPVSAAEPEEKTTAKPSSRTAPRNKSILFVDDEKAIASMIGELLSRFGYTVEIQTDPEKALASFTSTPDRFDLVITDMTMPRMNGVELYQKLRRIRPDTPVIVCTGHSSLIDEKTAAELGIAACVTKPVTAEELARTIRTVLDKVNQTGSESDQ